LVGWLVGWLVCWLVGWFVGLLVGWLTDLSRFANLVRRNYILLINTSLYIWALSWLLIGLCWCM
jgi:hypothetical protein